MPKPVPLLVAPNPHASLDDDGDPCGYVLRVDLRRLSAKPILLGAQRVVRDGAMKIEYTLAPVEVDDLPAYRKALRSGELFPGDEATARRVGVPWLPLDAQHAAAAVRAADAYQARFGVRPAWAVAPDPTPPADAPAPPSSPTPSEAP